MKLFYYADTDSLATRRRAREGPSGRLRNKRGSATGRRGGLVEGTVSGLCVTRRPRSYGPRCGPRDEFPTLGPVPSPKLAHAELPSAAEESYRMGMPNSSPPRPRAPPPASDSG